MGRVSQRWVVQAVRMSLRVTMMALAKAMNASMTRVRRSVQMWSYLRTYVHPTRDRVAGAGAALGAVYGT